MNKNLKLPTNDEIMDITKATFNTPVVTPSQLKYVLTMLVPSMYALAHHSIHGRPLTFIQPRDGIPQSHRPWQIDILNDQHPNKVIMKSRQLGLSEMAIIEMIWFADRYSEDKIKTLYTFPTNQQLDGFVKTRLNPLLEGGYYGSIVVNDTMKMKKIRNSFLQFRSSSKASTVEGVDLDYLVLDEYDRVNKAAEQSAIESLASSQFQVQRRFSTPTSPDYGIDDLYKHSDMKHYLHKCTHCGYWNQMKFANYDPDHLESSGNFLLVNPDGLHEMEREVEDGTFQYVCQKCGKPLDRWYNGEWVAEHPDIKGTSGYLISQMNAVWISADQIMRKKLTSKLAQQFYNYIIGAPYQDVSMVVNPADIYKHLRQDLPTQQDFRGNYAKIAVGIDWGTFHWITVMGIRGNGQRDIIRLFNVKESSSFKDINADIKKIMLEIKLYNPDIICADLGYNGVKVNQLIQEFGQDKVFGVKVNPAKSNADSAGELAPQWNPNRNEVRIDKLSQNLIMIEQLKTGRVGLWAEHDRTLATYLNHWQNVIIRDTENESNGEIYKEILRRGPDHWAQASVYASIGADYLLDDKDSDGENFAYELVNTHKPEAPTALGGYSKSKDPNDLFRLN